MCETHFFSLGLGREVGRQREGDSVGKGLAVFPVAATRTVSMMVFLYQSKWGCWEAGSGLGKQLARS